MTSPTILHIIPRDGIGGVEVAAHSMLSRDDLPCDFRLLVITGEALANDPERVVTLGCKHVGVVAALKVARAIVRAGPDVVIFSLWRTMPAALLTRLMRPRTRIVLFLHAADPAHLLDGMLSRLGMWLATAIWADSAATLLERSVPKRKPRQVVSFVIEQKDPPTKSSIEPSLRFVSWCRLTPQKGIDRSLRLVALLARRGHQIHYEVWGPDGGEQSALEQLAGELGIREQVSFRGPAPRASLPQIAADHCFYLQLSRFEGMAMAVVEAMQMGLVPVTTGVGQMSGYVRHLETGIRVDPHDLETAAAHIEAVIASPDLYDRLRRTAFAEWRDHPTYADDICRAATALIQQE